jgi:hypothetical protein
MVLVASDHKDGRGALSSNNSGPGKEDHPQTVPEFTLGVHYSLTIKAWYDNWISNTKKIHESKYATNRAGNKKGEFWYRLWVIFLAWSTIIAAQGSSTVFMITCHKNHKNDKKSVDENEPTIFGRMERWVGDKPIATQQ